MITIMVVYNFGDLYIIDQITIITCMSRLSALRQILFHVSYASLASTSGSNVANV